MYLYDEYESLRKHGHIKPVPECVTANLNPSFELRAYQRRAFENFITHFEDDTCPHPTQVLFHMATGSGKTLIMAGLILYLYKRGYRNFLFFVNLTNILAKTRDNFLNAANAKYLFADEIIFDGERVRVNVTKNFQHVDAAAINICFMTTQGLHDKLWTAQEGSMTLEDFDGRKVVFISDEAHHLNVDTGKKLSAAEETSRLSWEQTVNHIFKRNAENVLLEFTATPDLGNDSIRRKYEPLTVFNYALKNFYDEHYSKEIFTLRDAKDNRIWNALILSQYRLKIFQEYRLNIKPVVLIKSANITDNKSSLEKFIADVKQLDAAKLRALSTGGDGIIRRAFDYFARRGISLEALAAELRDDFSAAHCLCVDSKSNDDKNRLALNSLEAADNPYRAIFEVKKLDEGWDVLNLFDIVRLYDSRQSGGKKISPSTVAEAQLIGRGARYCPFELDDLPKYQRKFDTDAANDLRVCETLYYHCQTDSRYIAELRDALKKIGLDADRQGVTCEYKLKDSFKRDELYRHGVVFVNDCREVQRTFREFIPDKLYKFRRVVEIGRDKLMADESASVDARADFHTVHTTLGEIAAKSYAVVNKALRKFPIFKFAALKTRFANLNSTRQFITDENFLGGVRIAITSNEPELSLATLYAAACHVVGKISETLSEIKSTRCGTTEFRPKKIRDVFHDKTVNYSEARAGGLGTSQKISGLDLSAADWFAYNDNFGTSEEKSFVEYFRSYVDELRKIYRKVYLVRNERELKLYSFADGRGFEPDYVLFLQRNIDGGFEQFQIFVEPKGEHLTAYDDWKADFLLQLKARAVPAKIFVDDNRYRIWGLPFYNRECDADFDSAFRNLLEQKNYCHSTRAATT